MSNSLFAPHGLNETGGKKAGRIQQLFEGLMAEVESILTDGRELSLVRTKLQEASFFAVRGVAMKAENQIRA